MYFIHNLFLYSTNVFYLFRIWYRSIPFPSCEVLPLLEPARVASYELVLEQERKDLFILPPAPSMNFALDVV